MMKQTDKEEEKEPEEPVCKAGEAQRRAFDRIEDQYPAEWLRREW